MDQRKAFFFFGLMVLVWSVFWHGAIRVIATRHAAKKGGDSPAMSGLLVVA
jgi:hypothetical protein